MGGLSLAAPLALLALIALPAIWWLTRVLPPPPRELAFPPAELLRGLKPTEETPRAAPPWLALLRALALGLAILGLSGPTLQTAEPPGNGPLLIVIDDGWTSGPGWSAIVDEAAALARAAPGPVRLVFTAPDIARPSGGDVLSGPDAAARIRAAEPKPWLPDATGAASRVAALARPADGRVVWFSDGIDRPGLPELASAMRRFGPVTRRAPGPGALALTRHSGLSEGYLVSGVAAPGASGSAAIEAVDARGRVLARSSVAVTAPGGARLPVAPELARETASLRVAGTQSAGGVRLLDAFERRARVGLVAERRDAQPLLSDAHYVEAALSPHADLVRGEIAALAAAGMDAIILPDTGAMAETDRAALDSYAARGGLIVRFAGPKLVAATQEEAGPMPVALAGQPRNLRGGLALDGAGLVAAFDRASPFAGLAVPADARAGQIAVSAEGATPPQVWARLADGSALVSAAPRGRGLLVLVHTTAGPAWSDVAFSGLQMDMLRRIIARVSTQALPANVARPQAALKPVLVLDGFGRPRPAGPDDRLIQPQEATSARPGPGRPPGIYEGGGARLVLQAAGPDLSLRPQGRLAGIETREARFAEPLRLGPWLLAAGLVVLLAEALASLWLAGRLAGRTLPRPASLSVAVLIATLAGAVVTPLLPGAAHAQAAPPLLPPERATLRSGNEAAGRGDVQLAYIVTGDPALDERARRGLEALSRALAARTSVEPGPVVAVRPGQDDLARYPMLYWALPDVARETAPDAARALQRYMRTGGMLFLDTRGGGRIASETRMAARAALRGIETPPLERASDDHVVSRTFYLLRGFTGRFGPASLWVESAASADASDNDGVSPLILGDGDWAAQWAAAGARAGIEGGFANAGAPSEQALRLGINVVLYALTGNYKADQVHVPALLERLGPRARSGQRPVRPAMERTPR